ncbi:MAG TPA: hypothetical protein VMF03_14020 [Steroidobacteraceae bacterium]|nr:hypothetical protein [Steroidobacteraceae bacterium]
MKSITRTLPLTMLLAVLVALGLGGCVNEHENDSSPAATSNAPDSEDVTHGPGGTHAVNGSIHISSSAPGGEVSTINGSIHADDHAQLAAGQTVNGNISLGNDATATSLTTVNGGISLGRGVHVAQTVTTVNGTLALGPGAQVGGRLANVNGTIILVGATVNGGITTVNGNIEVGAHSHVQGGIIVRKPATGFFHWWGDSDKPRVVVGPGAVVEGPLRFERAVRLYVSDTATIGPVQGATAVRFSGEHPPE